MAVLLDLGGDKTDCNAYTQQRSDCPTDKWMLLKIINEKQQPKINLSSEWLD